MSTTSGFTKLYPKPSGSNPYEAPYLHIHSIQGYFIPSTSGSPRPIYKINSTDPIFLQADSMIINSFVVSLDAINTGGNTVSIGTAATSGGAIVKNIFSNATNLTQAQLLSGFQDVPAAANSFVGNNNYLSAALSGDFTSGADKSISVMIVYALSLTPFGNISNA